MKPNEDTAQEQGKPQPEEVKAGEGVAEVAEEAQTAPEQEEKAVETPEPTPQEKELAEAKERYIRLMADFDNMRKRQARELEERTARANERLLNALIPVFDHFEMALSAATEETPFVQGVKMIADEFRKVLEQSGAEAIDAKSGELFDPMMHEALTMAPHAEVPKGHVVNQFRKGWRLGGKVVRPAQVVVSAGVAEAEKPASEEEA